jgi:hypothetical protein
MGVSIFTGIRIIESATTTLSVFLDGGTAAVNMGLDGRGKFNFDASAVRHVLAIALSALMQLTLAGLLIRQAARSSNAKEKPG